MISEFPRFSTRFFALFSGTRRCSRARPGWDNTICLVLEIFTNFLSVLLLKNTMNCRIPSYGRIAHGKPVLMFLRRSTPRNSCPIQLKGRPWWTSHLPHWLSLGTSATIRMQLYTSMLENGTSGIMTRFPSCQLLYDLMLEIFLLWWLASDRSYAALVSIRASSSSATIQQRGWQR